MTKNDPKDVSYIHNVIHGKKGKKLNIGRFDLTARPVDSSRGEASSEMPFGLRIRSRVQVVAPSR